MTTDTTDQIRYHAEQILALLPPAESAHVIATADELADTLDTCADGAVLTLSKTLVYPERLALPKPVTLQSETYAANNTTRITLTEPAPTFMGGITATIDNYTLAGLALRGTDTIGVMGGLGGVWTAAASTCARRPPRPRGNGGRTFVRRGYVDDIFRRDQDTRHRRLIAQAARWMTATCRRPECAFGGSDSSIADAALDSLPRAR